MRTRVVQLAVAGAVLGGLFVLAACAGPPNGAGSALATKAVTVGAVEVKVEPVKLDASGAEFKVFFDGHSFDLGLDPARSATLTVAGQDWPVARWSGDPAGGHHRQGTLTFQPQGPVTGSAQMTIKGLPSPLQLTWNLGS